MKQMNYLKFPSLFKVSFFLPKTQIKSLTKGGSHVQELVRDEAKIYCFVQKKNKKRSKYFLLVFDHIILSTICHSIEW